MRSAVLTRSRRWRRVLALAALALVADPAAVVLGEDEPAPAVEGPWIVGVDADATVIVDEQGNVVMIGDAAERLRRCVSAPGCWAFWDNGIDTAVIVNPAVEAGRIDAAVERAASGQAP